MTTLLARWQGLLGWIAPIAVALVCLVVQAGMAAAQPFASVVMDARTGEILHSSNATARLHPASLTKMMTLYIAFEAVENGEIDLDTRVRISATAARQPPSRLGLREGQRISFRHLIRAAALRSANDAATAIAEALEGSVDGFAARMNRTARAMGMDRTTFRNPHGLTQDGHLSTARDMTTLGRQLYFDFPEYYNLFSRLTEDAGIARVSNTNRRLLSGYRGADGIKTGFTSAAGYNLTASAERDNVRIIVTVMGGRSSAHRHQQVTALLDRGFREAPRRAAIRRPSRPNYVRGVDDSGSGTAAGRVIRLQTAPTTSMFPVPRPDPSAPQVPPPDMVAAIEQSVAGVLTDLQSVATVAPPAVEARDVLADAGEDPDLPALGDDAAPVIALAAPAASPLPPARPDSLGPAIETTRADPDLSLVAPGLLAEAAPAPLAAPLTAMPDATASAEPGSTPIQFHHDAIDIAAVHVENGMVVIPGLPPIVDLSETPQGMIATARLEPEATVTDAVPVDPAAPQAVAAAPLIEPAQGGLAVDENGRILWQDEELLSALDDPDAAETIVPPTIVLTSSQDEIVPPPSPEPRIVARVANTGERLWAVDLGAYGSSFDAERTLLRMTLSEGSTLGSGTRHVQPARGRYHAQVLSLTQSEAEIACARLGARAQPCTVLQP